MYCSDADRVLFDGSVWRTTVLDFIADRLREKGVKVYSVQPQTQSKYPAYNRPFNLAALRHLDKVGSIFLRLGIPFGHRLRSYALYLDLVRPNALICIDAPQGFIVAAHQRAIPVIEVLHGRAHAYNFTHWDCAAYLRPDLVLVFDERSRDFLSALEMRTRLIPTPTSFQSWWSEDLQSDRMEYSVAVLPTYRKQILVSLMWGYDELVEVVQGFEPLANGCFFEEFYDIIRTCSDILWRFRLHPVQLKEERYRHHIDCVKDLSRQFRNVEWNLSSREPLATLLPQCDGHITMCSSLTYDCAEFGVKSLVLCPSVRSGLFSKTFEDLVAEGYVNKAEISVHDVCEWARGVQHLNIRPGSNGSLDLRDLIAELISLANKGFDS